MDRDSAVYEAVRQIGSALVVLVGEDAILPSEAKQILSLIRGFTVRRAFFSPPANENTSEELLIDFGDDSVKNDNSGGTILPADAGQTPKAGIDGGSGVNDEKDSTTPNQNAATTTEASVGGSQTNVVADPGIYRDLEILFPRSADKQHDKLNEHESQRSIDRVIGKQREASVDNQDSPVQQQSSPSLIDADDDDEAQLRQFKKALKSPAHKMQSQVKPTICPFFLTPGQWCSSPCRHGFVHRRLPGVTGEKLECYFWHHHRHCLKNPCTFEHHTTRHGIVARKPMARLKPNSGQGNDGRKSQD